jgi:hypothetical protein
MIRAPLQAGPFPAIGRQGWSILTEINASGRHPVRLVPDMGNLVFKCPRTGMNVQHWLADEPAPDDPPNKYETVPCLACSGLHFIHRASRRLLGEKES